MQAAVFTAVGLSVLESQYLNTIPCVRNLRTAPICVEHNVQTIYLRVAKKTIRAGKGCDVKSRKSIRGGRRERHIGAYLFIFVPATIPPICQETISVTCNQPNAPVTHWRRYTWNPCTRGISQKNRKFYSPTLTRSASLWSAIYHHVTISCCEKINWKQINSFLPSLGSLWTSPLWIWLFLHRYDGNHAHMGVKTKPISDVWLCVLCVAFIQTRNRHVMNFRSFDANLWQCMLDYTSVLNVANKQASYCCCNHRCKGLEFGIVK